jgi:hypothetical protein
MTAYSLSGLPAFTDFGTVTSEDHTKDAGLFQYPMPGHNSSSCVMLDLFGAGRTINLKGTYTGTPTNVATFIGQLDNLVNGAQVVRTFVSGKSGSSYYVLITSTNWTGGPGEVNKVDYTISMMEGSL